MTKKKKRHVRLWRVGQVIMTCSVVCYSLRGGSPRSPGAHSAQFGNLVLPLVIAPRMAASCRSVPHWCQSSRHAVHHRHPPPVDSSRDLHVILCAGTEAGLDLEAGCHLAPPGVPQERRDPASRTRRPRMALHLAPLRSSLQIILSTNPSWQPNSQGTDPGGGAR